MKPQEWISLVVSVGALMGTSGILLTPKIRRKITAEADLAEFERRERSTRLDLDVLRDSLTTAKADIAQLKTDRDAALEQISRMKQRHEEAVEEYERRIARMVGENYRLQDELTQVKNQLARMQGRTGGKS